MLGWPSKRTLTVTRRSWSSWRFKPQGTHTGVLHGKQPPDPTLPDVPLPKQHSDGDFLSLAAHGSEGEEPGGAEAEIEDQGEPPQLEEGEDGPQWPQGIFSDGEEEPVPALHTMRAGGGEHKPLQHFENFENFW